MKRVCEIVEEGIENLGLKKAKVYEGTDVGCSTVERGDGSEQVDESGNHLGNVDPAIIDGRSHGGLEELKKWDRDINSGLTITNGEEQNGLEVDLNFPVCEPLDDGLDNTSLGHTKKSMINEKQPELINIDSDDSDDEVKVVGYSDLSLELGMGNVAKAGGESSLVRGGERKYTKEEKGKATVDDQWLSLRASSSIDLDLHIDAEEPFRTAEPPADLGIGTLQQLSPLGVLAVVAERAALADLTEIAERIRAAEIAERAAAAERAERAAAAERAQRAQMRLAEMEYRAMMNEREQESRRRIAKDLARNSPKNKDEGSSSKTQSPSASSSIEQLGKFPGPFSEALKMVRQRTSKGSAPKLIEWEPAEGNPDRMITRPFVPSLTDISLKALAENAEAIVSLELIPDYLCRRLIHMLCDMRKMNAHILNLLLKGRPTEICIKDCSWITEELFQQAFMNCRTDDLRVLQLDLCGQCMLDLAFRDPSQKSSMNFSSLSIVSLRGSCRLTDTGLKNLVMAAPLLQSLNLGQCGLLSCDAVNCIADSLGSNLKELYIDYCQKINPMLILSAFKKFKCLEVISVAGIRLITDQFVSEMVTLCGQSLKEIDLANCVELTDSSLKAIGSHCAHLCSLNISTLHNLTDQGVEYLANGCRSIQKLELCRNRFSDEAMAAYLESSGGSLMKLILNNMRKVGSNTAFSIAKCSRKLKSLDISWCRGISDEALGLIVDSCQSLQLLKVFGCRQITNVFLGGHSNPAVRIVGLNMTPILDHMDLLEPEEMLLRYSALQA